MQSQIDTLATKQKEQINSLTNAGTKQKEQIKSLKTVLDQKVPKLL